MKKLAALLVAVLLLGGALNLGGPASEAAASGCTLATLDGSATNAGAETNPWLVGSASDFQQIGTSPCSLAHHYRQVASFTLTDPTLDTVPGNTFGNATGSFSGVYDGDFFIITLGGAWANTQTEYVTGIFTTIVGTVKNLYLRGEMNGPHRRMAPLARYLGDGGLVSRVSSTVRVTSTYSGSPGEALQLSGLVGRVRDGRIEYSRFGGRVFWNGSVTSSHTVNMGSLAALVEDSGSADADYTEIRDSYSVGSLEWSSGACSGTSKLEVGGLVGFTSAGRVDFVRSYSSTTLTGGPGCVVGGLVGRANNQTENKIYGVSTFWNNALGATSAIGQVGPFPQAGSVVFPETSYVSRLPVAVGVESSVLKSINTYQRKEGTGAGTGLPSTDPADGLSLMAEVDVVNLQEQDYRWAIETGNVLGFVASPYVDENNYLSRGQFTAPVSPVQMIGRRGTPTTPPNPGVLETAEDYPLLGRVWEICANENSGYPVLVWEMRDCTGSGNYDDYTSDGNGSDGGGGRDSESRESTEAEVALSSADPALAATGTSVPTPWLIVGMLLVWLGVALRGFFVRENSLRE